MDWASPFYLSFYPLCIRLYCQPFLIFPGHTGHQCDPGISVRFATFADSRRKLTAVIVLNISSGVVSPVFRSDADPSINCSNCFR